METSTTVLILGAGASKEADLPLGGELKERISRILIPAAGPKGFPMDGGDPVVWRALHSIASDRSEPGGSIYWFEVAAEQIINSESLSLSIDSFLESHSGDFYIEQCGKLAIVKSILNAERASYLYISEENESPIFPKAQILKGTWYPEFFRLCTRGVPKERLSEALSKVAIIDFNYDRCAEHFLFNAMRTYYRLERAEAAELMQDLPVHHPYGSIGKLPWRTENQAGAVAFGSGLVSPRTLIQLATGIKTFSEQTEQGSEVSEIQKLVSRAKKVVYLGFAYHKQNLELLQARNLWSAGTPGPHPIMLGTAFGISHDDVDHIKGAIGPKTFAESDERLILRNDLTCKEILNQYSRRLGLT